VKKWQDDFDGNSKGKVIVKNLVIITAKMFALIIIDCLVSGLTIMFMWSWFITPTFHLAKLSLTQSIGFGLMVALLTHQTSSKEEKDELGVLAKSVLFSTFITLIGWVVHLFL
jgi:hypothetical protein